MSPPLEETIPVPETGTTVHVRRCTAQVPGGKTFDIAVAIDDRGDGISQDLANGNFGFPPSYQLLFGLIRPGMTVLDLGANVGTFSLAAAALGARVFAVEASPQNAALLGRSVVWNGFENVRVVLDAVTDHEGTLQFLQAGPYGHVAQSPEDSHTLSVRAITGDRLMAELGLPGVDLIKMDIEGSEVAAIRGMRQLLAGPNAPVIVYEANGHTLSFFGETPNRLIAALEAFGYHSYLVEPGQVIPVHSPDLQPECTVDYLATRQPATPIPGWAPGPALTREQIITYALATCAHPHEHHRIYIARALAGAGQPIQQDPRIRQALERLIVDPNPDVRAAAAWSARKKSGWLRKLFG